MPAFVDVVALFVNPAEDEVRAVLDRVGPELLQFHGDETPQQCAHYGQRFLRAFRVGAPGLDTSAGLAAQCRAYGEAVGWLFDSYSTGYGGSGLAFDHALLDEVRAESLVASAHPVGRPEAGKRGPGGALAAAVGRRCEQRCRGRARNKSSDRISVFVAATQEADAK